ncbi:hypothetical protein [Hyphomonas pacifica]|uniref:hypothetical protein n=1 Tax=Hyphomonas pacifica TaxID=1280941 RepID=UPI000DBF91BF|nr:hypothetical protein [Hyphomonas pacifica]RAN33834.1 hypothetical protein HY11_03835 [Hyphomonas pacifica]
MKIALPAIWFVLGALVFVAAIGISGVAVPQETIPSMLAMNMPVAVLTLTMCVGIGLAYMLALKIRSSTPLLVFGILHLVATAFSQVSAVMGNIIRQKLMYQSMSMPDGSQMMSLYYSGASLLGFLGWVFFIIAMTIALNTKPPVEETF